MADFAPCLAAMLREESGLEQVAGGPYSRGEWSFMDDPADPGGATMMGVTHAVYDAWRRSHGQPVRDVREIDDDEISNIFAANYWVPVRGEELPAGVDLAVYDFAVNSGPARAVRELQAALGVPIDGHLGAVTMDAVWAAECVPLIYDLMDRRRRFCRGLGNYWRFGRGWEVRWDRIERKAALLAPSGADGAHGAATNARLPIVDGSLVVGADASWVSEAPSKGFPVLGIAGLAPANDLDDGRPTGGRAVDAPPKTSMAVSTTGNAAIVAGGMGLAGLGVAASAALQKTVLAGAWALGPAKFAGMWALALATTMEAWMAVGTLLPAAFIWFERKRKMLLGSA